VILPDVNVLIYAHREESAEHEGYARVVTNLATGDEPFGCSELVLSGFVRIVTNPSVFVDPTPLETSSPACAEKRTRAGSWWQMPTMLRWPSSTGVSG
jgi:predicted nucleic acid-binding protein